MKKVILTMTLRRSRAGMERLTLSLIGLRFLDMIADWAYPTGHTENQSRELSVALSYDSLRASLGSD